MYTKILVPLDGSSFGEHALPLAITLAKKSGAELHLVNIFTPLNVAYLEGASLIDESVEQDLKNQQQAYLDQVKGKLAGFCSVPVTTSLAEGDIAESISRVAVNSGADLVVMTTHARGTFGRFWLGSVADELIRLLPIPMILAHPTAQPPDFAGEVALKHLLIPLDGSTLAEQILEPVLSLAELMGSDLTLIRILKPVIAMEYPPEVASATQAVQAILEKVETIQKQLETEAKKYLDTVAQRLKDRGFHVQTRVDLEQQPALAILQDADPAQVDLVALETHGRRGLSRLLLGSVADKVVRGSRIPVLLHRPSHT